MKKTGFVLKHVFLFFIALLPFLWRALECYFLGLDPQSGFMQTVAVAISLICYFNIVPILYIGKAALICFLSDDVKHCIILSVTLAVSSVLSQIVFPPEVNESVGVDGTIVVLVFLALVRGAFLTGFVFLKYHMTKSKSRYSA